MEEGGGGPEPETAIIIIHLNKQPVIDARRALIESKRAEDEALKRAKEVKAQRKKL